jgi:hypothetical protein
LGAAGRGAAPARPATEYRGTDRAGCKPDHRWPTFSARGEAVRRHRDQALPGHRGRGQGGRTTGPRPLESNDSAGCRRLGGRRAARAGVGAFACGRRPAWTATGPRRPRGRAVRPRWAWRLTVLASEPQSCTGSSAPHLGRRPRLRGRGPGQPRPFAGLETGWA